MPIARMFLDWSQPALPAAVDVLIGRYAARDILDLEDVILVVPGSRAGRRMTELLVERAEQQSLVLLPPRICTVGRLPELLYESKRPFASDLVQQLVWAHALRTTDRAECRRYIAELPVEDDFGHWMDLGGLLKRQHGELAADGLDFAQVATRGSQLAGFHESDRWAFLSGVQKLYLHQLDELGLWDLQTARLFAIEHHECRTDKDIVLLATTDMNLALRRMLDQVADRVTAVVHAPASHADRFDGHGCLIPEAWQEARIDLDADQIRIVDGPAEQADAVLECLASFDGRHRADEVVIGVPDEQLVPQLLRRFAQADLPARWMVGRTVQETAPYRLLQALANQIDRGRFTDFASLARHPDVERWFLSQGLDGDWLTRLDTYYSDHLPPRLGEWLGGAESTAVLRETESALLAVTSDLRGDCRPLTEWASPIARLLLAFYGDRVFDTREANDYFTLRALEEIRGALDEQRQVPGAIAPPLTAGATIELLLEQVRGTPIPSPPDEQAIELLGWLELPLDTAPVLIVTSFNEGRVPTSANSDLFLPNALRQQLALIDNDRRYARDAYALSALRASRARLVLIAGRRTADDDPLEPSRLLFSADPETVAARAKAFFAVQEPAEEPGSIAAVWKEHKDRSAFVVRKPPPLAKPIKSISVTSFRSYLACPYRFYLQHVLGLRLMDDRAEELSAPAFGTLVHAILRRFGEDDSIKESTDADEIRRFLRHALNQHVAEWHGMEHLPAVDVQVVQAQARLDAFAQWQAGWSAQGWEIVHTETPGGKEPATLRLDRNLSITLRGRIDRIDHNAGRWAVFDYKTSDKAETPQQTHFKSGQWVDLQLPLYRHLVTSLEIEGPVSLGYIVVPKDVAKTGELMADWDESTLAGADEAAVEVATAIARGVFWPPADPPPRIMTEFGAICQESAFQPLLEGAEEEEPA